MGSRSRLLAAMALVVTPVSSGLYATPSFAAEAVTAKGGCWAYVPDYTGLPEPGNSEKLTDAELLQRLDARPARDGHDLAITSPQSGAVAWSPSANGATLELRSSGGTSVSSERAFDLTLTDGPVLDADTQRAGTAYAVLLVQPPGGLQEGQVPQRIIASTPFRAEAGASVGDLTFTTEEGLALTLEGDYRVALQSVHFMTEVPGAAPLMWTCNAQEATDPTGSATDPSTGEDKALNPATAPVALDDVASEFSVSEVSVLVLSDVLGQRATDAGRAGDELVLGTSGMSSATSYGVGFGPAGGPFVRAEQTLTTDEAGNVTAQVNVAVPQAAAPGPGVVTLLDADGNAVGAALAFEVLAAPALEVTETVADESLDLEVAGTGFDPGADVVVRSAADGTEAADESATFTADASGAVSGTYEVADVAATGLTAVQQREDGRAELTAEYTLSNKVPGAVVPPEPGPTNDPAPTNAPAPTGAPAPAPPVATNPAAPPVEIPLPSEVPVNRITEPSLEDEDASALVVSEARLDGETSWGELFGGVSRRQVIFLVENTGDAVAPNPLVRLGVGRSTDVEPALVAAEVGDLEPGARAAVSVNVALPIASFGTYQVVGQVGDDPSTAFDLRWDTYPWGLIGVNAAGVALLGWGVRRRQQKPVAPLTAAAGAEDGASVVDLTALDKWWKEGKVVPTPAVDDDNDSVVDLDAADRWWARNQTKAS